MWQHLMVSMNILAFGSYCAWQEIRAYRAIKCKTDGCIYDHIVIIKAKTSFYVTCLILKTIDTASHNPRRRYQYGKQYLNDNLFKNIFD